MTAATLRQMAAAEAIENSAIHMSSNLLKRVPPVRREATEGSEGKRRRGSGVPGDFPDGFATV